MGMVCYLTPIAADKIEQFVADPSALDAYMEELAEDENDLDVDKDWHIFHYLLTGTAWGGEEPACYLVCGGTEIGEDMGYGPQRLLQPAQVEAFHRFLQGLDEAELRSRYDPEAMEKLEIYGAGPLTEEEMGWVMETFNEMRAFVAEAAQRGDGMVIHLG